MATVTMATVTLRGDVVTMATVTLRGGVVTMATVTLRRDVVTMATVTLRGDGVTMATVTLRPASAAQMDLFFCFYSSHKLQHHTISDVVFMNLRNSPSSLVPQICYSGKCLGDNQQTSGTRRVDQPLAFWRGPGYSSSLRGPWAQLFPGYSSSLWGPGYSSSLGTALLWVQLFSGYSSSLWGPGYSSSLWGPGYSSSLWGPGYGSSLGTALL